MGRCLWRRTARRYRFTVSLLIGELAFEADPTRQQHVKLAVLAGTLIAALLAGILLTIRNHAYARPATTPPRSTLQ